MLFSFDISLESLLSTETKGISWLFKIDNIKISYFPLFFTFKMILHFFFYKISPKQLLFSETIGISWLLNIDNEKINQKLKHPYFFHTPGSEMCFLS